MAKVDIDGVAADGGGGGPLPRWRRPGTQTGRSAIRNVYRPVELISVRLSVRGAGSRVQNAQGTRDAGSSLSAGGSVPPPNQDIINHPRL